MPDYADETVTSSSPNVDEPDIRPYFACVFFFKCQKLSLTLIICDGVVLCVYFAGCRVAAKAKVCPAARAETGKAGAKWCLAEPARRAPPEDTGNETPKLGWCWCYGRGRAAFGGTNQGA